ncbi:MAG: hypothetical protein ACTSRK_09310 [Promethearchaeota archaeon]
MQFILNCAVLGDIYSAMLGFNELGLNGTENEDNVQFDTQINLDDDDINLSLIVPQNINEKGHSMLEMADGVIFFLDPNNIGNFEKLKKVLNQLTLIRSDFPIIIIIDSQELMIKSNLNSILSWIWLNHTAGVFILPKREYNLIQDYILHLCYAIIAGKPILNPETIWLQFPLLIKEINIQIALENWEIAALLSEKLTYLAKVTRSQDYLIYAEKTAVLFAKAQEYLKAAKMIKASNPVFAKQYHRKYIESVIEEGNQLFHEGQFEPAAIKYEMAGNWVRMELDDKELMNSSYKSAIVSWIAECEVQNGFQILEKFDHFDMIETLEEITEKIARLADELFEKGQYELAKAQLYLCFQRYQKAGLFDSLEILARKSVKLLKRIIYLNLERDDVDGAKLTFDELLNIWETYNIEPENVDDIIYKMVKLFVGRRDFQKVEVLIPKIESGDLQNELNEFRVATEERVKESARKGELKELYSNVELLTNYVTYEAKVFDEILFKVKEEAKEELKNDEFEVAEYLYMDKALWFSRIGQDDFNYKAWLELLNIYLSMNFYEKLFHHVSNIPEKERKEFLKDNISKIVTGFGNLKVEGDTVNFEDYLTKYIRLYRNHLLYDESRILAKLLIDSFIGIAERMSINLKQRGKVEGLIEYCIKIGNLKTRYLENENINLDSIYVKIVKFFFESKNYKEARLYADKIANKELSSSYCNKIDKEVADLSSTHAQKVQQSQNLEILAEKLSQLQNKARDQKLASENLLRMRSGLKRRYYQEAINLFRDEKYYDAAEKYIETAKELASTKKFDLAGVNLGVVTLLFLMLKNIRALKHELHKFKTDPRVNFEIFQKTYSYQLIDYIIQMIDSNLPDRLKSAMKLFEIFPFFPEERLILSTMLSVDIEYSTLLASHQETMASGKTQIPSNYRMLIDKIQPNVQLKNRRSTLELKYWGDCQDHFARQEYADAYVSYIEQSFNLFKRNYPDYALVSILMGFITQLKFKSQSDVYREYEKFVFQYGKTFETILQSDSIKLLDLLLFYWDKEGADEMLVSIMTTFQTNLPLFEWEISFSNRLIQKYQKSALDSDDTQNTNRTGISDTPEEDSLLIQQAIVLSQDISKLKDDFAQLMKKREKTVRTYYKDIIAKLQKGDKGNFQEASKMYIKLSKRMARRNDFDSASLMILLSTLSNIQAKMPMSEIQSELDKVLNGLGLVRKILEDYFGIKLAFFTLDMLNGKNESIKPYLVNMFNQLPLLEAEKQLIHL